eukprot:TRINITY_DN3202_c1_g1_i1.p1 TRINITY_DN3202_c1_g1~~TRINITY_DN3202_c1_g1_i1.p1  ORF type:complete len:611 (+),score=89.55 TRINITY_DN3202_c1_g1_i1:63-1895(+)
MEDLAQEMRAEVASTCGVLESVVSTAIEALSTTDSERLEGAKTAFFNFLLLTAKDSFEALFKRADSLIGQQRPANTALRQLLRTGGLKRAPIPSVCFSGIHGPEKDQMVHSILKLGAVVSERLYQFATTHLVCTPASAESARVRTAHSWGVAVVGPEWVAASRQANQLLPPSDFVIEPYRSAQVRVGAELWARGTPPAGLPVATQLTRPPDPVVLGATVSQPGTAPLVLAAGAAARDGSKQPLGAAKPTAISASLEGAEDPLRMAATSLDAVVNLVSQGLSALTPAPASTLPTGFLGLARSQPAGGGKRVTRAMLSGAQQSVAGPPAKRPRQTKAGIDYSALQSSHGTSLQSESLTAAAAVDSEPARPSGIWTQAPETQEVRWDHSDSTSQLRAQLHQKVFQFGGMKKPQREALAIQIRKLGGDIEPSNHYEARATHLIVPNTTSERTEKYLSFVAARKWVLPVAFVEESTRQGSWISEKDFPMGSSVERPVQIQQHVAPPFAAWRVLLVVAASIREGLEVILKAGGCRVLLQSLDPESLPLVTHVFTDDNKRVVLQNQQPQKMSSRQMQKLSCYTIEYIFQYLCVTGAQTALEKFRVAVSVKENDDLDV